MHDTSEPLISCEIDMEKQGIALAKTTLNHVVCAIKTPHRAVQVLQGYLILSLKMQVAVVRAEL
jgi:hypothetical protein